MRLDNLLEAPVDTTFGTVYADWLVRNNKHKQPLIGFIQNLRFPGFISTRKITSLKGSPREIMNTFDCSHHLLTSLEHGPEIVGDNYNCSSNKLTSLKGAPAKEDGFESYSIDCSANLLKSLEGLPTETKGINCSYNQLTTLRGAPAIINGSLIINDNQLTSLQGIHKIIKELDGVLMLGNNPIKSHVLGLLKIKKLANFSCNQTDVEKIINKHLESDRDVMACQDELIDAGFEEYAQL